MSFNIITGVLTVAFVLALAFILSGASAFFREGGAQKKAGAPKPRPAAPDSPGDAAPAPAGRRNCPLCGTALGPGENVASRVYPRGASQDGLCTIHGCPHCQPVPEEGVTRVCPVCKKEVPPGGHLLARIFYRPGKKQHVHIVGCSECHKKT
jgi:RNase P subunit RPR2